MHELFVDCISLKSLPEISKWNTNNVIDIKSLFYGCKSLLSLPDISKWNTNNVINQNYKNLWDLYIKNSAYSPDTLKTGNYNAEEEFGNKKAVFYQNGNWEYDALVNTYKLDPSKLTMIPMYSGVEGEENAGLSSGTENYWIVNKKANDEAIDATLDFMYWLVTDEEATKQLATTFGYIAFKKAVPSNNVFLEKANQLASEGKYTMLWAFIFTPNSVEWRKELVEALVVYSKDNSDQNWELVKTAFVDGWAKHYKIENNLE